MKTIEIAVPLGHQLSAWLNEMRVWLDERRFEPSQFLYDTTREGVVVFVDFKEAAEAEAFARQFGGRTCDLR